MEQIKNKENKNLIFSALKGALISVCTSLIAILIFAFIIKLTNMSEGLIKPINQIIKILSIFLGTFFVLKKTKEKGLFTGIIIGLIYTILAFVVFSLLNGYFEFDLSLLYDTIFGIISGAICGTICINFISK